MGPDTGADRAGGAPGLKPPTQAQHPVDKKIKLTEWSGCCNQKPKTFWALAVRAGDGTRESAGAHAFLAPCRYSSMTACGRGDVRRLAKNNLEKKKWICYAELNFSTCQQRFDFLTSVLA